MTGLERPAPAQPLRAFSDAGPVSRMYRKYLGRASITILAVIILSAYLLPLLYMAMTAFQQPGQSSTPGAPPYPAKPQTGIYQGQEYPIYTVAIDGVQRELMLVKKGREQSSFVDPADPKATLIPWTGRWRRRRSSPTASPGSGFPAGTSCSSSCSGRSSCPSRSP